MNSKQKLSVQVTVSLAVASFLAWAYFGFNTFTQTKVLVDKKDELFNTTYKVWEDKFIWGLDLSLLIAGVSLLIGGVLYYVFKNRNKTS